jgi:TMEM175 potassium channel family protein
VSKARLEAFSDGVIAVAITLLALNLRVPAPATLTHGLGRALLEQWPSYAAYATSFITIGIIWINHHAMIGRLRQPDHMILSLNLLLLLWIAELPFATDLMAAYLKQGHGEKLAAAVYAGSFLMMAITFTALNRHILFTKSHLLAAKLLEERRREILRRSIRGLAPYALATVLAVVSPYVTLIICAAIAGYYALPIAQGGSDETEEQLF